MKETFKRFFDRLLTKVASKLNQYLNKGKGDTSVSADDGTVINFFKMVLKKVLNHVFLQCSFDVITDSTIAEPLTELCKDLQKNCYKIGAYMLGGSDTPLSISECWVVPYFESFNGQRVLRHSYIDGSRVRISAMSGDRISECYMILDAVRRNDKTYLLCRKHTLDENGTLTVSFFTADENAREVSAPVPEWESMIISEVSYPAAGNIGFGRYKSPVLSFDDGVYGKPLNYNCAFIEKKIRDVIDQIRIEFKASGKKLFADSSIVRRYDREGNPLGINTIDEYIFPIQSKSGVDNKYMQEFSSEIRESAYYTHLTHLLEQYQALMGVNELITHERSGKGATATEIRALNLDNISLEESIRATVREGNIETLRADAMYLGIREELYSYDETWTDIYEDEQQRLDNLMTVFNAGCAEQIDVVKYQYPTLSDEQAQAKCDRINAAKQTDTLGSLEAMLSE